MYYKWCHFKGGQIKLSFLDPMHLKYAQDNTSGNMDTVKSIVKLVKSYIGQTCQMTLIK